MSSFEPLIHCTNPGCPSPLNPPGRLLCESCQTPVVERYLWAKGTAPLSPGEKVVDRYQVIAPQIWLDTKPELLPDFPEKLPDEIVPYLQLYPQRLHIPEVFGFVRQTANPSASIILLENIPVEATGHLYPSITDAWSKAMPVRQVYWLWQILQLWTPLAAAGVASSLLVANNLRVQGWRVRLLELLTAADTPHPSEPPSLQHLGECWEAWAREAQAPVVEPLQEIAQQLIRKDVELTAIATQLNQLLLSLAAELPLRKQVAGASDAGPNRSHNEDNCYPTAQDLPDDALIPYLTIVCDGIGGHEGGEVASQLALQSLKLQIRALLAEMVQQTEIVSPQLLKEQLEAILRVVNNLIAARNDDQGRSERQRMGTTLVMALQVPQRLQTRGGWESDNAHELYLAHIGDSRAYWITPTYCLPLSLDDDVATREVRLGRSLYRQALQRQDAGALTQALGTRDGELLRPTIQRFILEEDGLLLLCSDGLSDNNWVEHSWKDYAVPVLKGELSLEDAVRQWINLANLRNGHDNTSVVLSHYRVSPEYPVPFTPRLAVVNPLELEFSEASKALMYPDVREAEAVPVTAKKGQRRRLGMVLVLGLLVLLGGSAVGLFGLWQLNRKEFQQLCQRLPKSLEQVCSPASQPVSPPRPPTPQP